MGIQSCIREHISASDIRFSILRIGWTTTKTTRCAIAFAHTTNDVIQNGAANADGRRKNVKKVTLEAIEETIMKCVLRTQLMNH